MKAKISYTIDINAIPEEISKLLKVEINKLKSAIKDLNFSDHNNISLMISKIDLLRKILLDVDTRAAECYSILEGVKQAMLNDNQEVNNGAVSE